MKLLNKINQGIQRWLFKEEIEATEQRIAQGLPVTPEEFEAERKAEFEKMERLSREAADKIKAEDHSKAPSQADINRYYNYHENYVHNMQGLEKSGQKLWTKAPERVINLEEFNEKAHTEGWSYLRNSIGLPMGDLSKPSTPWVAGQPTPNWNVNQDNKGWDKGEPEIHVGTETEEQVKKPRRRGM